MMMMMMMMRCHELASTFSPPKGDFRRTKLFSFLLALQDWMFFESAALWNSTTGQLTFFLREGKVGLEFLTFFF